MKSKFNKKEVATCLVVNAVLALLNYQTNHFAFVWFVYPLAIWGGIILVNRFVD